MRRNEVALFFFDSKTGQLVTASGEDPIIPVRRHCLAFPNMRRARVVGNRKARTMPSMLCAAYDKRGRWLATFTREGETRRNPGLGLFLLLLQFPLTAVLGTILIIAGSFVASGDFGIEPIRWSKLAPQIQVSLVTLGLASGGIVRLAYALLRDRILIWYARPVHAPLGSAKRDVFYKRLAKRKRNELVPLEISFVPTEIAWPSPEKHSEWASTLAQNGFELFGQYYLPEVGSFEEFWFDSENDLTATIISFPTRGMWISALTRYEDGSSFLVANKYSPGLDPHPTKKILYLGIQAGAEDVIAKALSNRPNLPRRRPTPENILDDYKNSWREYVQWRRCRGTTAKEYKQIDLWRNLRKAIRNAPPSLQSPD